MIERFFREVIDSYDQRFVSRRLILAIDLLIVAFAFISACFLRFNFALRDINWSLFQYYLIFLLLVRWGFFLLFHSYHGIVRHTSFEDVRLIFRTVSASSLFIALSTFLLATVLDDIRFYIPVSVLLIEYFVCLFLMIASRFFVKSIYQDVAFKLIRTLPQDVIIYGAGSLGTLTRDVLLKEPQKIYNILCFIDDNPTLVQKSIAGVRIESLGSAFEKYFQEQESSIEVIMAIQNINTPRKKEILELFLQKNIVVKVVPSTNDWLEGTLSTGQIRKIRIEDLLEREPILLNSNNIQEQLSGKVVAITGAAGSIGSEIARQVVRYAPSTLVLVDQSESGLYDLEFELRQSFASFLEETELISMVGNVTDPVRIERVFVLHHPQVIYHAAAYKHVPLMERYPYESIKTNVLGTQIVADLSARFDVEKFVFVSTDKAVNPTNVMGATKRLAEMYVQSLNTDANVSTKFIITRFGNVLGSNGSVVPIFKKQIEAGGPVTVTHPNMIRYFMTIPEACQLVLEAGAMGQSDDVYVFDMGEPVKIEVLARRMIQLSGLIVEKDIKIEYTGLRPGEKLFEELLSDDATNVPTHHPKILIARLPAVSLPDVQQVIEELKVVLPTADREAMVTLLKTIVPEFISKNSEFEKLDLMLRKSIVYDRKSELNLADENRP